MKKLLIGALSLNLFVSPFLVYAEEITVSGNGESSTNNVNVNTDSSTNVTQDNTAQVTNDVNITADTGNNSASDNSGESSITTGDITVDTAIENSSINQSYVATECCNGDTSIKISGNGSSSDNSVNYSNSSNTNIDVNNQANISNSIYGWANTGYNSANDNLGDVTIDTGSIKVIDNIRNSGINLANVSASQGVGGDVSIIISDNGSESDNSVVLALSSDLDINVDNQANISNISSWEANTGKNEANGNNGNVSISTGDIVITTTIENTDINTSWVDVDCCEEKTSPPPDGNPPTPPAQAGGGGASAGAGAGQVLAAVTQDILPVTGNYLMPIFLLANVVMFFLGWFLRLRSGRAPNLLYAR